MSNTRQIVKISCRFLFPDLIIISLYNNLAKEVKGGQNDDFLQLYTISGVDM